MLFNYDQTIITTDIDTLIEDNMAFIIKCITSVTGKYVSLDNDDELSIGLIAFTEAVKKYDINKGHFYSFAKLVITSRIKSYIIREHKNTNNISLDELTENGIDISNICSSPIENKDALIDEINNFKIELRSFGLTLEALADDAPKHEDTRRRAVEVSETISEDKIITNIIFDKKRLPIKQISLKYNVTEKILKRSKNFIISLVIIFFRKYRNLLLWIRK